MKLKVPHHPSIGIIPCGKEKLDHEAPAYKMYTSSQFRMAYEAATLEHDQVLILSAKYGLLKPDQIIEPYDIKMGDEGEISDEELRDQFQKINEEAEETFGEDASMLSFYTLLPKKYFDRLDPIAREIWVYLQDTYEANRGIGDQRGICSTIKNFSHLLRRGIAGVAVNPKTGEAHDEHQKLPEGGTKTVCVTASLTYLGVPYEKIGETGKLFDGKREKYLEKEGFVITNRMGDFREYWRGNKPTMNAFRDLMKSNHPDWIVPADSHFLVCVHGSTYCHALVVDANGKTVCDTAPRKVDRREIVELWHVRNPLFQSIERTADSEGVRQIRNNQKQNIMYKLESNLADLIEQAVGKIKNAETVGFSIEGQKGILHLNRREISTFDTAGYQSMPFESFSFYTEKKRKIKETAQHRDLFNQIADILDEQEKAQEEKAQKATAGKRTLIEIDGKKLGVVGFMRYHLDGSLSVQEIGQKVVETFPQYDEEDPIHLKKAITIVRRVIYNAKKGQYGEEFLNLSYKKIKTVAPKKETPMKKTTRKLSKKRSVAKKKTTTRKAKAA